MEENSDSISHLVKKRKLQDDLSEMPSPKKVQSNAINDESMEESGSSNSLNFNADDDDDEANTDEYPDSDLPTSSSSMCYSDLPASSSSMSYSDLPTSSSSMSYSDLPASPSAATSSYTSSTDQQESLSLSINEQPDCSNSNSSSEHKTAGVDQECIDSKFENMLYSNTVAPSCNNYVLSSGRWPVNQDSQQGSKKLTIDREFEQYFSKLML